LCAEYGASLVPQFGIGVQFTPEAPQNIPLLTPTASAEEVKE